MGIYKQYHQKLISAHQAVDKVKSGDWVGYGHMLTAPVFIDQALADKVGTLENVKIRCSGFPGFSSVVTTDPEQNSFIYNSAFLTMADRAINQNGSVSYIPSLYHELPGFSRRHYSFDICFIRTSLMDDHGYFNFGICNDCTRSVIEASKIVVLEINSNIPVCLGGNCESVHLSEVDFVVESDNEPLLEIPRSEPTDNDFRIANHILNELVDGACIQLGIGGRPDVLGRMIADADLKDLGIQTEMMVDAYLDLIKAGKVTNKKKAIDVGKSTYTFATGSKELYEFLDKNSSTASYPVSYTNDPKNIAANDHAVSINSCIAVDLYGQVSSESVGPRQISGTGGQFDFHFGAYHSKGGNAYLCLNSTRADKCGTVSSNIMPFFTRGTIVTVPRTVTHKIVTEFGVASLKGKSTWERAEALIEVAHPDFQDELVKSAEELGVWKSMRRLAN